MESNILLTIVIPAYNAEKYIAGTLDSIIQQKTNFEFSILISDDCSTDNTYAVCVDYKARFPFIEVIKQEQNLGMTANQHFVITKPQTKYIAYIDSDDLYACDTYLQQQFDFLELNEKCAVAFTNVEIFGEDQESKIRFTDSTKPPTLFDLDTYFAKVIPICNSAMVFRSSFNESIPSFFKYYFQYDWLLHIHHGLHGQFGFNDFIGTRYRVHSNNATNSRNTEKIAKDGIALVYKMQEFLPAEYHKYFTHPRYEMNKLALYYLSQRRIFDFLKWYFKWLKVTPFHSVNWRDQFYLFRQALFNR
jgi:glycosyltransferase involved in cell wall biosynthesis